MDSGILQSPFLSPINKRTETSVFLSPQILTRQIEHTISKKSEAESREVTCGQKRTFQQAFSVESTSPSKRSRTIRVPSSSDGIKEASTKEKLQLMCLK